MSDERTTGGLKRAAQQTIYGRPVRLAYPVMYDLRNVNTARNFTTPRLALRLRPFFSFPTRISSPSSLTVRSSSGASRPPARWAPIIAVAQAHAVGSGSDARIPGIPTSITDVLFKPVSQGGLRPKKLEFYSPRNRFRYLPRSRGSWS